MESGPPAGLLFPLLGLEIVEDSSGPFFDGFHIPFAPEKWADDLLP